MLTPYIADEQVEWLVLLYPVKTGAYEAQRMTVQKVMTLEDPQPPHRINVDHQPTSEELSALVNAYVLLHQLNPKTCAMMVTVEKTTRMVYRPPWT